MTKSTSKQHLSSFYSFKSSHQEKEFVLLGTQKGLQNKRFSQFENDTKQIVRKTEDRKTQNWSLKRRLSTFNYFSKLYRCKHEFDEHLCVVRFLDFLPFCFQAHCEGFDAQSQKNEGIHAKFNTTGALFIWLYLTPDGQIGTSDMQNRKNRT